MAISHPSIEKDYTLVFKDTKLPISRCLFGLYSKKFRKLPQFIYSDSLDATIDFIAKESFEIFINACQSQYYQLTTDNTFDILYLCNEWDTEVIKSEVERFISISFEPEILVSQYSFAIKSNSNNQNDIEKIIAKDLQKFITLDSFINLPMKSIEQIFTQSDISQIDQHQLFIFISSVVNTHRPTETSLFGYLDPQSLTEDELESLKSLTKSMNSIPMESLYNQIDSFLNTFAQQNQSIIEFRKKISDLEQSQAENDSLNKKRINKLKELINESTKSKPDEEQSQVSKQLSAFTDQLTQNQSLIDSLTAKCNELDDMYQTVSTMINSITSSGARPPDKKQEPKKTTSVRRSFFFGSKEKKPETPRVDRRAITFLVQQPKDPKAIPTSRSIEFLNRHQSTVLPNQAPSMGHPIAVGSITKEPTSENVPFSGILYYLTQQCGGNIHTEGIVNITASTTMGQGPETIVDFGGPWYWSSRNEPNSWVRFDFKEKTIQVSGYTIKTYPFQANKDHLKSWVLEGCNNPDNNSWETIHSEKNCNDLNGPGKWKTFKCNRSKEYRYIRIKSTGPNHIGYNTLVIANIEFFGILK